MYQAGLWHRQHHLRLRLSLRVSGKHDEVREDAGSDRRGERKALPPECREVYFKLVKVCTAETPFVHTSPFLAHRMFFTKYHVEY